MVSFVADYEIFLFESVIKVPHALCQLEQLPVPVIFHGLRNGLPGLRAFMSMPVILDY